MFFPCRDRALYGDGSSRWPRPGFPGAHSHGETLEELQANLQEVIAMLLEDGEPPLESDFVGLQQIMLPA